jgi:hypothetical protein
MIPHFYCIACDFEGPLMIEPRREQWTIKGEVIRFTLTIRKCPQCGCWETVGPLGADIALKIYEERKSK